MWFTQNRGNRTTPSDGASVLGAPPASAYRRREPLPVRRLTRAALRLARERRRLRHRPTIAQLRALARWDGREPCSYLLDPEVNFVPDLWDGLEHELGRHALRFSARDGRLQRELVVFPGGAGFDLLSRCN